VLTADVAPPGPDAKTVGTDAFAHAVADRLGHEPKSLERAVHHKLEAGNIVVDQVARPVKQLVGLDVFLDWDERDRNPNVLGPLLESLAGSAMKLRMITNRGTKVYPDGVPETFCTDHWRCRFVGADEQPIDHAQVLALLSRLSEAGLDFIKTEHLYTFDGERGYSLGQGE
jgi:isocitrate dehydrogenase